MTLPTQASGRRMLVTSALPYANGDIHLGHLVEYIQTDVWVRYQKLCGHEVHYVCADDTHGTPIMLRAEALGITPETLIEGVWHEHTRDFRDFGIAFDHYYTTHSEENRELAQRIYGALNEVGLIERRSIEQMYDPEREMFLPDRFIRGTCPRCGATEQYGDSCEACGATYSPTDLIEPRSVVSGAVPVRRNSEHHFFRLSDQRCVDFLRQWALEGDRLQSEARNKLREWLGHADCTAGMEAGGGDAKLADWDISRDAPYFGFEIPGAPGKYFYVWLDAPIGYYASFLRHARNQNLDFDAFTRPDSSCPLHRQGHHLLPHALLAGDAQDRRVQSAAEGPHPRVPHRRWAEDVEVARHVRPRPYVPRPPRPFVPPLLLRLETDGQGRGP